MIRIRKNSKNSKKTFFEILKKHFLIEPKKQLNTRKTTQ